MKQVKEWKEPWKKKEPGARLSSRALKDQQICHKQREDMEKTQDVKVFCKRELFSQAGLFYSFTVSMKIPLRKEEIDERMKAAFPELIWRDS